MRAGVHRMKGPSRLRCKLSSAVALGRHLLGKRSRRGTAAAVDKDLVPLAKTETETETEVGSLAFPRTRSLCESHTHTTSREGAGGEGGRSKVRTLQSCLWYLPRVRKSPSPQRRHCSCQALACALTAGTGTRSP